MKELYRIGVEAGDVFSEKENRDLVILRLVSDEGQPVGSGTLAARMAELGWDIGEATAGRWLRELELRGHLESAGRLGRRLTPAGCDYLRELETQHTHWQATNQMAQVLLAASERQLIDILVARSALEAEAAWLAARHASNQDLKRLRDMVTNPHDVSDLEEHAQYDLAFHFAVADASGNQVIAAAVRMIRSSEPRGLLLNVLRGIRP